MAKLLPKCPKCGAEIPQEVCQECGHVPLDSELEELRAKANKLKYKRCTDGHSGYVVSLGEDALGVVWYARECSGWYANEEVDAASPDHGLGTGFFRERELAGEALRKQWQTTAKQRGKDRAAEQALQERREKLHPLFLEVRQRTEQAELLEKATMTFTFPNRWLSEPYSKVVCCWINFRCELRAYEDGDISKTALQRKIRAHLKEVKKHLREGADRMASWTGADRL